VYGYAAAPIAGCFASSNLPPRGQRQEIHSGAREGDAECGRVVERRSAVDAVLRKEAAADDVVGADLGAHALEDLERQAHAVFARAAVTVVARVQRRQERRHRVGVRVVQLDAVESRFARPAGGGGEQAGQHARQFADVRQLRIGDALACAHAQRLQLARVEYFGEPLRGQREQRVAHLRFRGIGEPERAPVPVGDRQVPAEEFRRLGPAPDRQEVDHLDEELRFAVARLVHRVDDAPQPRHEAVVADAQQRPARHVADAGGLDDDRAGPASREARVPVDVVLGDEAVVGGAPRHHRRHPGARGEFQRTEAQRREQGRASACSRDGHSPAGFHLIFCGGRHMSRFRRSWK